MSSNGERGPSWQDLRRDMAGIAKVHNRAISVQLGLHGAKGVENSLYVRVVATGPLLPNGTRSEVAEAHQWPANDWATMPAMCLALLWRLEYKLSEMAERAEEQAHF